MYIYSIWFICLVIPIILLSEFPLIFYSFQTSGFLNQATCFIWIKFGLKIIRSSNKILTLAADSIRSSVGDGLFVDFGQDSGVEFLDKEEVLNQLRFRSVPLKGDDCSRVKEGEHVLAANKSGLGSLFYDAKVEKVYITFLYTEVIMMLLLRCTRDFSYNAYRCNKACLWGESLV